MNRQQHHCVTSCIGAENKVGRDREEVVDNEKRESGMVSVETALGTLALALVFTIMLSVIGASAMYLHAQDLSRSAARSLSLGNSPQEVHTSVTEADSRASLTIKESSESVVATVTLEPPAPIKALGVSISATAVAPKEPGAAP